MSKDFNETVLHRIRSRWSCACGGQTMSLMRRRAVEKRVRRAARLSWVPRFHLGHATAQMTNGRCQLCGLLLVSTCDFSRLFRSQHAGLQVTFGRQQFHAARHCHYISGGSCTYSPALPRSANVQGTPSTETCVRVRGVVTQLLRAT
jgi:hypothetical protein